MNPPQCENLLFRIGAGGLEGVGLPGQETSGPVLVPRLRGRTSPCATAWSPGGALVCGPDAPGSLALTPCCPLAVWCPGSVTCSLGHRMATLTPGLSAAGPDFCSQGDLFVFQLTPCNLKPPPHPLGSPRAGCPSGRRQAEQTPLRPRNPKGRTGLRGCGSLSCFGPNHTLQPVVTR